MLANKEINVNYTFQEVKIDEVFSTFCENPDDSILKHLKEKYTFCNNVQADKEPKQHGKDAALKCLAKYGISEIFYYDDDIKAWVEII